MLTAAQLQLDVSNILSEMSGTNPGDPRWRGLVAQRKKAQDALDNFIASEKSASNATTNSNADQSSNATVDNNPISNFSSNFKTNIVDPQKSVYKPEVYDFSENKTAPSIKMKKGGAISLASSRGDGCAQRGKTRGRIV
jgi:hypothetical protein